MFFEFAKNFLGRGAVETSHTSHLSRRRVERRRSSVQAKSEPARPERMRLSALPPESRTRARARVSKYLRRSALLSRTKPFGLWSWVLVGFAAARIAVPL